MIETKYTVKYFEIDREIVSSYQGNRWFIIHTPSFVEEEIDLAKGFTNVQPAWISNNIRKDER